MPSDKARYRLLAAGQSEQAEAGEGLLELSGDGLTLTSPASMPLRIRFRDIASVEAADFTIRLTLQAGEVVEISGLAKRYEAVARELQETRRSHFDASLLLEEGGGADQTPGLFRRRAADGRREAERTCALRPQRTSLAVLCEDQLPFVVPYGAVKDVGFDAEDHAVVLSMWDGSALELLKLGRRTEAVRREIVERLSALASRSAQALAALAPDLSPLALRALAGVLRDGIPASREAIEQAAPGAWEAIGARCFAAGRRCYAAALEQRAGRRWLAVKELVHASDDGSGDQATSEEEESAASAEPSEAEGGEESGGESDQGDGATLPPECDDRRLLYVFEIGKVLVVEAPGSENVATYLFRAGGDPAARVEALCRAFAAVQFRREPVYLPEEKLGSGPHARYREAVRLVSELRSAREAFLGRATHVSLKKWSAALDQAIAKAC